VTSLLQHREALLQQQRKEAVTLVATSSVESGATSNNGKGGNCKSASPISLHTSLREVQKRPLADTLLGR